MLFKCPICSFTSKSISHVKRHFRIHHLNRGLTVCPVCGKSFDDSIRLVIHVMSVKDERHKPYRYLVFNPNGANITGLRRNELREIAKKHFAVGGD